MASCFHSGSSHVIINSSDSNLNIRLPQLDGLRNVEKSISNQIKTKGTLNIISWLNQVIIKSNSKNKGNWINIGYC